MNKFAYLAAGFSQLGYVTRDLDAAVAFFTAQLGVAKFMRLTPAPILDETYLGQPAAQMRTNIAFGQAGKVNIELIQPLSGESTYSHYLREHPGQVTGLHHVGVQVYDWDKAGQDLRTLGYEAVQTGRFGAGTRFMYVDTRATLGHYTEFFYYDEAAERLFDQIRRADF